MSIILFHTNYSQYYTQLDINELIANDGQLQLEKEYELVLAWLPSSQYAFACVRVPQQLRELDGQVMTSSLAALDQQERKANLSLLQVAAHEGERNAHLSLLQ